LVVVELLAGVPPPPFNFSCSGFAPTTPKLSLRPGLTSFRDPQTIVRVMPNTLPVRITRPSGRVSLCLCAAVLVAPAIAAVPGTPKSAQVGAKIQPASLSRVPTTPAVSESAPALARTAGVNGGFADAGLRGEYFANPSFEGAPAFVRRDVRIDFDWNGASPAGSTAEPYRSFPTDDFSIRWTGRLLPRFAGAYTLAATADDTIRVEIKPAGAADWATVIDGRATPGRPSARLTGTYTFPAAGKPYDIRVEYRHPAESGRERAGIVRLGWTGPATAWEVIDPASSLAMNIASDGFADAIKIAPEGWKTAPGLDKEAPRDSDGWPTTDAATLFGADASHPAGAYAIRFHGQADLAASSADVLISDKAWDEATNLTTAKMVVPGGNRPPFYLLLTKTRRNATADLNSGVTDVRALLPQHAGGDTPYAAGALFRSDYRDALSRFIALRFGGAEGAAGTAWSDRTPATSATQRPTPSSDGGAAGSGMAWEYRVMIANETGKDLYLTLPMSANDDYITKIAQLVRYGSDGATPYTSAQTKPVFPPLNSNLKGYVEWGDSGDPATWRENAASAQALIAAGGPEGKALTFDGVKDPDVLAGRRVALRTKQVSELFRDVFGDAALGVRVRVILPWQITDGLATPTAETELAFLDRFFDNGDGTTHVETPHPASYFVWGGGGPASYSAENAAGLSGPLPGGDFQNPHVGDKVEAPIGGAWTFVGSSGIVRNGSKSFGGPRNPGGDQSGYLMGIGAMELTFTLPATQTSPVYALRFKAVQRHRPENMNSDNQTFDVLIDGKKADAGTGAQAWYKPIADWSAFDTATFTGAPGSRHTVEIVGLGNDGVRMPGDLNAVMIDDVQLTSVDGIYRKPVPDGGFAGRLARSANWARAYGLHPVISGGGWSFGNNTTPIEIAAKFGDPRAAGANESALYAFSSAGGQGGLEVFGADNVWSRFESADHEPLPRSIDTANGTLSAATRGGATLPATLTPANKTTDYGDKNLAFDDAGALPKGRWICWNVTAPETAEYRLTLETDGGAPRLFVDGERVAVAAKSVDAGAIPVRLVAGPHSIALRSTGAQPVRLTGIKVEKPATKD
jgi:hypothetical protein